MARFCGQCGTALTDGLRFCPNCGKPLEGAPVGGAVTVSASPQPTINERFHHAASLDSDAAQSAQPGAVPSDHAPYPQTAQPAQSRLQAGPSLDDAYPYAQQKPQATQPQAGPSPYAPYPYAPQAPQPTQPQTGPAGFAPYPQTPAAPKKKKKGWLIPVIIVGALIVIGLMITVLSSLGKGDSDPVNTPAPTSVPTAVPDLNPTPTPGPTNGPVKTKEETWTVCMYLCSADLERRTEWTTRNLVGISNANIPENINIIAQTGGGRGLHLGEHGVSEADDTMQQRWLVTHGAITLLEEERLSSMGDSDTLSDFLSFCINNYPSDHIIVFLQDHGGTAGICFDEYFSNEYSSQDFLTLAEIRDAFAKVFDLNANDPPVDLVYFNACLMGTIDSCSTLRDVSHYFVGSEEEGWTWDYSGIFEKLAQNPSMTVENFGRCIVDEYEEFFDKNPDACMSETIALVDLSKADEMIEAYHEFGADILWDSSRDFSYLVRFSYCASNSLPLGPENDRRGYFNLIDLGTLAEQYSGEYASADKLLSGLESCVIYSHYGPYQSNAYGLGFYYPINQRFCSPDLYYIELTDTADSDCFYYLYEYQLFGYLDDRAWDLMDKPVSTAAAPLKVENIALENLMLSVDENGTTYIILDDQEMAAVQSASLQIYVELEEYGYIWLGNLDDLIIDRDNGLIYDVFCADFLYFENDGIQYLTYADLLYKNDNMARYGLRVMVNGEEKYLNVVSDFATGEYTIIGYEDIPDELTDFAQASPVKPLKTGDVVSCLVAFTFDFDFMNKSSVDFVMLDISSFVYDENKTEVKYAISYEENEIVYYYRYQIKDASGNYVYTNYAKGIQNGYTMDVGIIEPNVW